MKSREFANGVVYAHKTHDDYVIETTDTFLPYYTKCTNDKMSNILENNYLGDRSERWMIGVSVASGCPIGCKFCATGAMKRYRPLTAQEIVHQVDMIVSKNPKFNPITSREFKINYTRMGEPFLNLKAVQEAIHIIEWRYPGTHHYVSTIGIKGSDFTFINKNITLQISLHSLNDSRRDDLIPWTNKMSIPELGLIRTKSNLKTTLNLTLVDNDDFSISELKKHFDPEFFFIKLSPINENPVSIAAGVGRGIIESSNIL